MAKAYQCDRCMKYYSDNKEVIIPGGSSNDFVRTVTLSASQSNESLSRKKTYELCDDCTKELVDWLKFKSIVKSRD